jgi:hypothetical protein
VYWRKETRVISTTPAKKVKDREHFAADEIAA